MLFFPVLQTRFIFFAEVCRSQLPKIQWEQLSFPTTPRHHFDFHLHFPHDFLWEHSRTIARSSPYSDELNCDYFGRTYHRQHRIFCYLFNNYVKLIHILFTFRNHRHSIQILHDVIIFSIVIFKWNYYNSVFLLVDFG